MQEGRFIPVLCRPQQIFFSSTTVFASPKRAIAFWAVLKTTPEGHNQSSEAPFVFNYPYRLLASQYNNLAYMMYEFTR